jgi:myo-inositol 2-dehydrogenase/D-chiro-inositol 1-dehydrogenase
MNSDDSSVSRRSILAGAGAFTIVAPSAVRGTQANSKISVGLIGVGNRGTYDATFVNADPRARITALCDIFEEKIAAGIQKIKAEKPDAYQSFEKLLASEVDAVIIATPVFEHPRMVEAAIQARKHIYCEKPAGADVAGCKRVIAAGRRADPKKCISWGFQQRYGPVYIEGFNRLKSGMIGDLLYAQAYWYSASGGGGGGPARTQEWPANPTQEFKIRNWYRFRDLCGDFIVEQDCHNFDVLHWFLEGLPERAAGYGGRKLNRPGDTLDHLSLTFEWPNGLHVNYQAGTIMPPPGMVGEGFGGTKGSILTSRQRMARYEGPKEVELIKSPRDITYDGLEAWLGRILSGNVENVAERSALSTLIAILGRTALYEKREATWKKDIGV